MKKLASVILAAVVILPSPSLGLAHEMENPVNASESPVQEPEPEPSKWSANIMLVLGGQFMRDSHWKDLDADQLESTELGVDFGRVDWPVSVYIGAASGTVKNVSGYRGRDLSISDFLVGPRYYLSSQGALRAYLSGGVALISLSRDRNGYRDSNEVDSARGAFINTGAFLKLGKYFNLGADLTYVAGGKMSGANDSSHFRAGLSLGVGGM